MTEFLNKNDICLVCFGSSLDSKLLKHHISYFPERVAYVHYDCHNRIHSVPLTNFIQYDEGDSSKFYDNESNKTKDQTIEARLKS